MNSLFQKASRKSREAARTVAIRAGLKRLKTLPPKATILCYHGIDANGSTQLNSRFISQGYFEKQLQYFKKHFDIVPLSHFYKQEAIEVKRPTLALTFDDGYLNNLTRALPLLEKYQLPATFFVTSINTLTAPMIWADQYDLCTAHWDQPLHIRSETYIKNWRGHYRRSSDGALLKWLCCESDYGFKQAVLAAFPPEANQFQSNPRWDDYWKPMNDAQIQQLSRSSVATIGSHGQYHNDLACQPTQAAFAELQQNKAYLESLIQQPVVDLAYPHGNSTDILAQKAHGLGFTRQLAQGNQQESGLPYVKERFGINPYISWENQLYYLLRASYS